MATTRPFAYNTGGPISGTTSFGSTLISGDIQVDYSEDYGGVKWWMGPDEELGYVIGNSRPSGQPIPSGATGTAQLGFWRSKFKTNESFLELANYIGAKNGQPPFANTTDAENWLNSQGYYSSYDIPTPTPTPTITQTTTPSATSIPLTPSSTETPTPTPSVTSTNTPSPTNTQTPTNTITPSITPSITPTITPTNPALIQMYNDTTGSRTITSFQLDGVTQSLTQGTYPISSGNTGFISTHGVNVGINGVSFNFGGSGTFDLYSYLNGTLVNYLSSYNSGTYVMGGTILQTSDQLILRITNPGALATPTPTATATNTPTITQTPTNTPTPSTTPIPVTGYGYNLVVLPYQPPTSGNTIFPTFASPGLNSGTTNPNTFATNAVYWNAIDNLGINRSNYYNGMTGVSVTAYFTQNSNTVIYSGSSTAFTYDGGPGNEAFNYNPNVRPNQLVLIQSANTNFVTGQTVYISYVVN